MGHGGQRCGSTRMRVLVACEFSGVVREAFRKRGHNAWSCDLLDTEIEDHHLIGNVLDYINDDWDLMIAHPPCTYLASSGARWWSGRLKEQYEAIGFVDNLLCTNIPKIAIENPVGILSTIYRKPDQIIQPWQFGHGETKATCLWLKGLPKLIPTNIVEGREPRIANMPQSLNRSKERSRTFQGIADAMAEQWG